MCTQWRTSNQQYNEFLEELIIILTKTLCNINRPLYKLKEAFQYRVELLCCSLFLTKRLISQLWGVRHLEYKSANENISALIRKGELKGAITYTK